ncbi:protein YIPF5-like [Teleopsis dalmanni]|uniref:protein YIPF5-like n=1 Tax=Teleopsis dalmanni TaxID=139649 RepID=UPI0018CEC0FD|nr:protein YIPF5-like [Teleopsis dalmanni]
MSSYGKPHDAFNPAVQVDNFAMSDLGQELNFQNFKNTQSSMLSCYLAPNQTSLYNPNQFADDSFNDSQCGTDLEFDDEPPLLEELEINPRHIFLKILAVLNPMREADRFVLEDTDMAGPLVICLALGCFHLLSGKVTFSYIYGIGVMGCIAFYCLLSIMAEKSLVTFGAVVSVLGYCLLPMVMLSGMNVLIIVQGTIGLIVAGIVILWCAISASKLFVTAYSMDHQQVLIAYPCALLYGVFALITIF